MTENKNNYGITFTGLLQVALIVLKLCSVINWSWWLVLLPLIISGTFSIIFLVLAIILVFKTTK